MKANIRNTFQTITVVTSQIAAEPDGLNLDNSTGSSVTIDNDSYVNNLAIALAGRQTSNDDSELVKGMKILAYMQHEGVFGISSMGRYQSVIDFIKTKSFEYELEQRQFRLDEFLRETETAIYEILARGNSTRIAKSLLDAAESVNTFRNHLTQLSDELLIKP